jgi:hypothetical protein
MPDDRPFRLAHPFSGAVYKALGDGRVEVSKGARVGIFDMYGRWESGDLRSADAEMVRWVGTHGRTAESRHRAGFAERDATRGG